VNYLAHAYLSFDQPDILVGNMTSDFIKGKKQFDYPLSIQKGIKLHRAIDEFTDFHPVTQEAKSFFRPAYRLYSGAFADVVYDHFLAIDTGEFANEAALDTFCRKTYQQLQVQLDMLPVKFQQLLPYMQTQNWLYNYRYREGIQKSFGGLVRRSVYLTESDTAFQVFNDSYEKLQMCYAAFFPELKKFASDQLIKMNNS